MGKEHTFGRVAFGGYLSIGLPEDAPGSQDCSKECGCMHCEKSRVVKIQLQLMFYASQRKVSMGNRAKTKVREG